MRKTLAVLAGPQIQKRTKILISLGAGVQSSTLALMAAKGELSPMPDGAIFADTMGEPQSVYRWLDYLIKQLPFPVCTVSNGSLEEMVMTPRTSKKGEPYYRTAIPFHTLDRKGKIGRVSHRTCTHDYKIVPIMRQCRNEVKSKAITAWRTRNLVDLKKWRDHQKYLKAKRKAIKDHAPLPDYVPFPTRSWEAMQENALIEQWIGISLDESQRMKPSREPWIRCRWPLVEKRMTRQLCLEWMESHGYPTPPPLRVLFLPVPLEQRVEAPERERPGGLGEGGRIRQESEGTSGRHQLEIQSVYPSVLRPARRGGPSGRRGQGATPVVERRVCGDLWGVNLEST